MKLRRDMKKMGKLAGLLWPYAKPDLFRLFCGALLSLFLLALLLARPWPVRWIFDDPTGNNVGLAAGAFLLLVFIAGLVEYFQRLTLTGLGNRILHRFRHAVFARVMDHSIAFHERRTPGELLTRIIYDTQRLRRGVVNLLLRVFQSMALFVGTIVVLAIIDPVLGSVVLVVGLLAGTAMLYTGSRIFTAAKKHRKREGMLADVVEENLQGIRELQTFRMGGIADPRFEKQNKKSLKQELKLRRLEARLIFRVEALLAIGICLVLWLGSTAGRTAGELALFLTYMFLLQRPFYQFARQSAHIGRILACADRLTKIMNLEPAVADDPEAIAASDLKGGMEFRNVRLSVKKKRRSGRAKVLRGASFTVKPGERIAIMGPNGAGKSSLLKLAVRLLDPNDGSVLVDGKDVRDYKVDTLRQQMSIMYQETNLFGLSVRDNISLGRPRASKDEIKQAAKKARCAELIDRLKDGYKTIVRRRGLLLSGGERQRIALARAILGNGNIWLLDEPTANLDSRTAHELEKILLRSTEGKTVLWVTHDVRTATRLDRIIVLSAGQIRYDGKIDDLSKRDLKEFRIHA